MGDGRDRKPEEKQVKATPTEQTVVANQGGRIETSGKPAEAVLKGVPSNDQLLTSTRDDQVRRLEQAGVRMNPATGYPEELSSPDQARSVMRSGAQPFLTSERENEVREAVAKRNNELINGLVGRNLRETAHYVAAADNIQTDLTKATGKMGTGNIA